MDKEHLTEYIIELLSVCSAKKLRLVYSFLQGLTGEVSLKE